MNIRLIFALLIFALSIGVIWHNLPRPKPQAGATACTGYVTVSRQMMPGECRVI